jgi:hypothetical protein
VLPEVLLEKAISSNNEFGWKLEHFEEALSIAASCNLACLGGQFQWKFASGTCEAYWLNADSKEKLENESWSQYVARSNEEVLQKFKLLCSSVNFEEESNRFEFLKSERQKGVNVSNHLIFVAYFVAESKNA